MFQGDKIIVSKLPTILHFSGLCLTLLSDSHHTLSKVAVGSPKHIPFTVEELCWKEAVFLFSSGSVHFISIPGIIIVAREREYVGKAWISRWRRVDNCD